MWLNNGDNDVKGWMTVAMFEGSRYRNVYAYEENYKGKTVTAFHIRRLHPIDLRGSTKHIWIDSDRLDNLSARYYEDPQYWWFILDANPRYMEEHEIQNGDTLIIPTYSELRRVVEDNGE